MEQIEDALIKKGKDICEVIEQLIGFDNKFLIERAKSYCKYCLSLNKDDVNSICNNFYEECENYLEKLESNLNNKLEVEQIEKQFITSYESTLAKEGKEICKEVDSIFNDNDDLMVEKANTYCQFIDSKVDCVDKKLVERCQNYIDDVNNFHKFKSTLKQVNIDRRKRESSLDMRHMRHMRLNGI